MITGDLRIWLGIWSIQKLPGIYKHKACSFPQVQLKSQQRTDPLESYSRSSVVRTEREEVDMMQL
jgi:hypothetical protein